MIINNGNTGNEFAQYSSLLQKSLNLSIKSEILTQKVQFTNTGPRDFSSSKAYSGRYRSEGTHPEKQDINKLRQFGTATQRMLKKNNLNMMPTAQQPNSARYPNRVISIQSLIGDSRSQSKVSASNESLEIGQYLRNQSHKDNRLQVNGKIIYQVQELDCGKAQALKHVQIVHQLFDNRTLQVRNQDQNIPQFSN